MEGGKEPCTHTDVELYYSYKNNLYTVHFVNHKHLSLSTLTKMMSVYGPTASVTSPQNSQLCYVRFKRLEDSIKCIHSLKNSEDVRLLQHKFKLTPNLKDKSKQYTNPNDLEKSGLDVWNLATYTNSNLPTKSVVVNKEAKIPTFPSNKNEIPSLTDNSGNEIVIAEEVVIANIHPAVKIEDILVLLKDHRPICTSFIKQVPNTEIKYCHVYLPTTDDALAVEKRFDKYLLHKQVLIVLRLNTLIEEAI